MDGAECHVVGPEVLTEAAEMVVQVASVLAAGERFEELIPPERSPVSRSMWECGGGRLLRGVLARAGERAGPRVASRECCPLTAPVEYPPRTVNQHLQARLRKLTAWYARLYSIGIREFPNKRASERNLPSRAGIRPTRR